MTTTGNEQRDELAEAAYRGNYNDRDSPRIQPLVERSDNERRRMYATADAILAAGYRKPRTITTVEELDALPNGSVLLDPDGDVSRRVLGGWTTTVMEGDGSMWLTGNQEDMELPATVLYEPEAEGVA